MKRIGTILVTAIAIVLGVSHVSAQRTPLKVLSAIGMRQVLLQLAPEFERASGYTLAIEFDSTGVIAKRVAGGEQVDVVMINESAMSDLVTSGKVVGDSMTRIAASVAAVAIRKGAPRPDISSPDAFRRMLLAAGSVARPSPAVGGSSGDHIVKVLQQLGIQADVDAKSVIVLPGFASGGGASPGEVVAKGNADVALHQFQELMAVPGLDILGPFPGVLAGTFDFAAALGVNAREPNAGKALIAFLTTPAAKAVIKAKGMQSPAP